MKNSDTAAISKKLKHQPDDFWHRLLNWELVRGFGRSPLATLSIAMPFVGYAILYHSEIRVYLGDLGGLLSVQELELRRSDSSAGAVPEDNGMSFHTKLNLFYLGSCLVGLGTIVYRLFAPATVKEFSSLSDFVDRELSRATARKLRSMIVAVRARRPNVAATLISIAPWLVKSHSQLKIASNELRALKDDQLQIDVLSSFYNVESRYYLRWAVYLTSFLYCLGFALISIPGLIFTFRVIKVAILQMFG